MLSSSKIAEKAGLLLQDATNVRWAIPEMAKWINAGCRELVMLKPTALTANVAMLLTAGTKQSLLGATFKKTADGSATTIAPLQLLEVTRNLGTTGTEAQAGRAITGVKREILDVTLPGWHSAASTSEVLHFMFDPKDPKTFYVYPKATADPVMYVEVVMSKAPTNTLLDTATSLGSDDIDSEIDDIYESVLVDYVLYRAYSKDSQHTANANRAAWHYQAFQAALGVKFKNEVVMKPHQMFDGQASAAVPVGDVG